MRSVVSSAEAEETWSGIIVCTDQRTVDLPKRTGFGCGSAHCATGGHTASMEKVLDAMGYKIIVKRKDPTRAWW